MNIHFGFFIYNMRTDSGVNKQFFSFADFNCERAHNNPCPCLESNPGSQSAASHHTETHTSTQPSHYNTETSVCHSVCVATDLFDALHSNWMKRLDSLSLLPSSFQLETPIRVR